MCSLFGSLSLDPASYTNTLVPGLSSSYSSQTCCAVGDKQDGELATIYRGVILLHFVYWTAVVRAVLGRLQVVILDARVSVLAAHFNCRC